MPIRRQISLFTLTLTFGVLALAATAHAQSNQGAQLAQSKPAAQAPAPSTQPPAAAAETPKDPREGDPAYEQAQRLMKAIDSILQDTARQRGEARKLPSDKDFLMKPLWTETKEDREKKVRDLLDSALGIVTDVPVVDVQKKIEGLRKNIREHDDRIVKLREKQIVAPKDGVLPGLITDTVDSLSKDIDETKKKIELNREEIAKAKGEIQEALNKAGIKLAPEQVDLLLDSVLSGDLVRLVAVFNSAKMIDGQLGRLMNASGENIGAARKYFAMHAALFAMLLHSQDLLIEKIDKQYLPKLSAIEADIRAARVKTAELLQGREPRGPEAGARRQPRKPAAGRGRGQGLPALSAAAARAGGQGPPARHPRPAHRRQHLRDGGGELPAAQPDAGFGCLLRGDPAAGGADLRPDLQERGAAARVREPHPQARRAFQLRPTTLAAHKGTSGVSGDSSAPVARMLFPPSPWSVKTWPGAP